MKEAKIIYEQRGILNRDVRAVLSRVADVRSRKGPQIQARLLLCRREEGIQQWPSTWRSDRDHEGGFPGLPQEEGVA